MISSKKKHIHAQPSKPVIQDNKVWGKTKCAAKFIAKDVQCKLIWFFYPEVSWAVQDPGDAAPITDPRASKCLNI